MHRLARLGWLLPTPVRGTWEFAPAEHAGAIPDADPLLPLKALLPPVAELCEDKPSRRRALDSASTFGGDGGARDARRARRLTGTRRPRAGVSPMAVSAQSPDPAEPAPPDSRL